MDESHEEQADALEKEADFLEKNSDRVGRMIKDTREDWDSKKSSNQAPGAADPDDAAPGGPGEEEDD
jgi:hypothetical protein